MWFYLNFFFNICILNTSVYNLVGEFYNEEVLPMGQHLDSSHDKIHFSGVSIWEKAEKVYASKWPNLIPSFLRG